MKSLLLNKLSALCILLSFITVQVNAQVNVPKSGSTNWSICGGTLYSNNGPNSDFSDGTDGTIVIYPDRVGPSINISGTTDLGDNDHIYIYNGVGTGGSNLYTHDGPTWGVGSRTKNANVTSTDGTGALTFRSKNDKGWFNASSSGRWNVAVSCHWAQWVSLNEGGSDWGNSATKTVQATVKNIGTVAFGDGFYICAFIDGVEYGRVPGAGLAPQATTTYSIPLIVPCFTGNHTLSFDIVKADENLWFSANSYNIGTTSTTVTINRTALAVSVSHSSLVCENGTITLNASPDGYVYSWSGPDGFASAVQNPSITNMSPAKFGSYTVTVTDYACSATGSVTINTMNPAPVITISGNTVTCPGNTVELTASSSTATSYVWSNSATTASTFVTPTATTTYYVTGTDAVGCSSTIQHTISANLPDVVITPASAEICIGDDNTLTAGGAVSYVWSNSSTDESITVNPGNTTSYSVTGTDIYGCQNHASFNLIVHALPNIEIIGNDVVCLGDTTELTATGGVSYAWSNGDLTALSKVYPEETALFTVTGTDIHGCKNSKDLTVQVWQLPDVSISGNNAICIGNNTTLRAHGTAISYLWSNAETTVTTTVAPTQTSTYSVVGTGSNGCKRKAEYSITVNSLPNVVITGADAICTGDAATLQANGAVSYVWNDNNTTAEVNVFPTEETTYSVTGTDENGCQNSGVHTLVVNALPNVSISTLDGELCFGESTELTANGAIDYLWSTQENSTDITVTPEHTTNYLVTGTDVNGCKNHASYSVLVHALPNVVISGKAAICIGDTTILTASGANDYEWSTAATSSSIRIFPESTTFYSVTGTDVYGCKKEIEHSVVVNALPTVVITGDATACAGERINLSVSGAETYEWSNNETRNSFSVYPQVGDVYTVTGTDINGCQNTDEFSVTVNPIPVVTISGNHTICEGSTVTLQASGAVTYTWFDNHTGASNQVSPLLTTNYYVRGTDANGCTGIAQHTVNVNPKPHLFVTGNEPVCRGESMTLYASGANSAYIWGDGSTSTSNTITPSETMVYILRGINSGGCTAILQIPVIVKSTPTIEIAAVNPICEGNSTQLTVSGTNTYKWSTNETSPVITVTPASTSTYTVTGTNTKGCDAIAQVTVTVNPNPQITILGENTICKNGNAHLTAVGADQYLWSNGETSQSITVSPSETQQYSVTGTTISGCSAIAATTVTVNPLPDIAITGNDIVCAGESTTLTVSGADNYRWSTSASSASITITPSTLSTYSVTGTTLAGCTATAEKAITVRTLPVVSISGDNAVCSGSPATLNASGANSYIWSSDNETSSSITVHPTEMTLYTVTGTDLNGCSASAVVAVNVNTNPTITFAGNNALCIGSDALIRALGAAEFVWSTGETSAAITVSPVETTTYSVTGTSSAGCSSTADITITVSDCNVTSIFSGTGSWNNNERWSNGIPKNYVSAIINGDCTVPADYAAVCNDLTLSASSRFTVSAGAELNISGEMLLKADAAGRASYINHGDVTYAKDSKVERYIAAGQTDHFTVPVTGAVSGLYSGAELKLFEESQNSWNTIIEEDAELTTGTGYSCSASDESVIVYCGTLHEDPEYTLNLSTDHCHLNVIGNMFTAHLRADVPQWSKTNVANGIWIWDPANENYRTWNGEHGSLQHYMISSQQALIVKATGANAGITFHKTALTHETHSLPAADNSNMINLTVSGNNRSDNALVKFSSLATHDWDAEYDVEKLHGSAAAPQLASIWNGKMYSINYLPSISDTIFPLYFNCETSGDFTIELKGLTSLDPAQQIRFEDTKTGIITPLTSDAYSYSFSHTYSSTDNGERFRLIFGSLSGINDHNLDKVNVYEYDGKIIILNSEMKPIQGVSVYNALGQQVYADQTPTSQTRMEIDLQTAPGSYFVKLISNGKELTKKVIIR